MRKSGRNPKPCLRERCTAPNGVGKVCKPSVLPCPMYKLPLAPSQLPTFHRTFKQILILPSRVNWRERLVYEGLQDCSRCKNPFSHQTVNKLCVHLFCTSSHYLRKVNQDSWCWSLFLLYWRSLQCGLHLPILNDFPSIVPVVFDLVRLSAAPHVTRWTSYLSCLHRIILCLMI